LSICVTQFVAPGQLYYHPRVFRAKEFFFRQYILFLCSVVLGLFSCLLHTHRATHRATQKSFRKCATICSRQGFFWKYIFVPSPSVCFPVCITQFVTAGSSTYSSESCPCKRGVFRQSIFCFFVAPYPVCLSSASHSHHGRASYIIIRELFV